VTVVARTFISVPAYSATDTWERIVALIAPDSESPARGELSAVAGVACSCIADEALAEDPLVVFGVGPRLRVYALYGDDAVDQERTNESALGWVPTDGDWRMSIPCLADDLGWVRAKLAKVSTRVTAREVGTTAEGAESGGGREESSGADAPASMDLDAFFRR
jgi:hypothetical protein